MLSMFDDKKQKFLFKCADCSIIISIELYDEEDIEEVRNNKYILECTCGGKGYILRD